MRPKSRRIRDRLAKKLALLSQQQTCLQTKSQPDKLDPQIQYSNSQLSKTLSTGYSPKQIICRQQEKEGMFSQFSYFKFSGAMYVNYYHVDISGVPGVGKTASTMEIVSQIRNRVNGKKCVFGYFNAMNLTTPTQIYKLINKQLYNPSKNDIHQNPPIKLTLKFQKDNRIKFLIIDEIDYLITKNQNILYNLFQWCNSPQTKLCSIIIANTMDFPQKLQSKITSRMGQNRLVFKPYSQHEVQQIIQARLMKSNRFTKDSIIYACKKMSSFTSDVRKLLYILTRALQLKQNTTITTEDMCSCWKKFAQVTGDLWQERLPQFYKNIMEIIKDKGGMCTINDILQRMCCITKYNRTQLMITLKQMQQMTLIRIKYKKVNCLPIPEITLLKI